MTKKTGNVLAEIRAFNESKKFMNMADKKHHFKRIMDNNCPDSVRDAFAKKHPELMESCGYRENSLFRV
jgi:hypothetical protein